MKLYLIASICLLVPLAFAGVIRQTPPSFKVVYDQNQFNSISLGASNLMVRTSDDNLSVTSSLGNMEIKLTGQSFVVESVPAPDLDKTEILSSNQNENDKYDVVNDKLQSSTENPKIDCMNSELKELIIRCDGNLRLRRFTEEERRKAAETRAKVKEQFEERMKEFQERMHKSLQDMRSGFGNFMPKIPNFPQPSFMGGSS